jgi:hypothetical protein
MATVTISMAVAPGAANRDGTQKLHVAIRPSSAALAWPTRRCLDPPRIAVCGNGPADSAAAQEINFDQINKFESLGTGTLHVGAPPKTIIDDSERHVVILTIWDADAETKVYWRSPDGNDARTTVIPGKGIQTFQTAGEFRLEAIGEPNREVNYGYVLLGLKSR